MQFFSNQFYSSQRIIQVVNTQTGAVATGTTVMPGDDTIPQITEGDQYMSLAITPGNASNLLLIEVVCHISNNSATQKLVAALFQDAIANALACSAHEMLTATNPACLKIQYYMAAGTVAETTFRVRCGSQNVGTTTFNGSNSARLYGGVLTSSITITEIKA